MEKTKKCPYCGEEIMAAAKKCRHCGEWLDGDAPTHSSPPQSNGKNNIFKYAILATVVIVAIVVAVVKLGKSPTAEDDTIPTETNTPEVIPPADHPYTVDEVLDNIAEYDANESEEEKAKEPWRIHLNKLQGTYLLDTESSMADVHDSYKYVISGNTLTQYSWNNNTNSWERNFSSEFQLFKFHEDSYMNGYNLIYTNQYGDECRLCSGDANGDGKMDLWMSDSMFWTKQ